MTVCKHCGKVIVRRETSPSGWSHPLNEVHVLGTTKIKKGILMHNYFCNSASTGDNRMATPRLGPFHFEGL